MADQSGALISEEGVAIPLKGLQRDTEQVRRALAQWLAPRVDADRVVAVSPMTTPEGTGVANETLLWDATWRAAGHECSGRFVTRVASTRPLYLDADIEVQAKIYQALADADDVPVPRVYGYEADPGILGAPFFVMERIPGSKTSSV